MSSSPYPSLHKRLPETAAVALSLLFGGLDPGRVKPQIGAMQHQPHFLTWLIGRDPASVYCPSNNLPIAIVPLGRLGIGDGSVISGVISTSPLCCSFSPKYLSLLRNLTLALMRSDVAAQLREIVFDI